MDARAGSLGDEGRTRSDARVHASLALAVCPTNTYSSSPGSSTCTNCPAGYYTLGSGNSNAIACQRTPRFSDRRGAARVCTLRDPDLWAAANPFLLTAHTACPSGTYSNGTGDNCAGIAEGNIWDARCPRDSALTKISSFCQREQPAH